MLCAPNGSPSDTAVYGYLYNWYAVDDTRGLCPAGWEVPSLFDWQSVIDYPADELWNTGTNSTEFSALTAGYRDLSGYNGFGSSGVWWSSEENSFDPTSSYAFSITGTAVTIAPRNKHEGVSVRCIK